MDSSYEISLAELLELISAKVKPAAAGAGVAFTGDVNGVGALTNSDANLILLILDNLIQNAIQATPRGRSVYLTLSVQKNDLTCQVTDEGPGVPEEFRQSLFGPCRSTKPGGSGIGLAISKQLAAHLAADLDLTQSSLEGTTFTLRLPARILRHAEPVSARANS